MTTPNRPPLWEVMYSNDAYCAPAKEYKKDIAPVIRALRDWLFPEEDLDLRPPTDGGLIAGVEWCVDKERQRLRALLTAEADRAEQGDHD